jgi:hypothetical protein
MAGTLMIFPFGANSEQIDLSSVQLNGSASLAKNKHEREVLRLTPAKPEQTGSAFTKDKVNTATFSTVFAFQITEPTYEGAEGLVFVVQSVKPDYIGKNSYGLGYFSDESKQSIGVEFDTWNTGEWAGDTDDNHVGINTQGRLEGTVASVIPSFKEGHIWYVWVDYDGSQLEVRLNFENNERPDQALLTQSLNLTEILGGTEAFVGFTAATGGAFANHDILSWTYRDSFNPIKDTIALSKLAPYSRLKDGWIHAHVDSGNTRGEWGEKFICPPNTSASAFKLLVDSSIMSLLRDDTALNNIQLRCTAGDKSSELGESEAPGWAKWGDWISCPENEFLVSYAIRVEPDQEGEDNTSANDVKFGCSEDSSQILESDNGEVWGVWSELAYCQPNEAICGFQARIEPRKDGDNTMLNDLKFKCCTRANIQ